RPAGPNSRPGRRTRPAFPLAQRERGPGGEDSRERGSGGEDPRERWSPAEDRRSFPGTPAVAGPTLIGSPGPWRIRRAQRTRGELRYEIGRASGREGREDQ